ncbi:hypothetical protein DNU06_01450 [Putridiphycobacter roseus]|uniref:Acyltransferase 3 domain-containing protein n=1 Tax=Putridiphycobacter roseus TaxID=2219161 RepID=A0A2W1NKZ6_9FLAO|nr:acyltransferase [Putridiphycobacter roseus]PZE18526.1 hypothetical protein DNU06_01450 [Putridiphycobacter roseus]
MSKTFDYQIPVINSLRGLAALLVCLYHYIYTTTDFIQQELILDIASFGKYGVQIFFIISGIVIPISLIKANFKYKLFNKFILKRFIRIEPPYLISVIIGIIYLNVRNYMPGSADLDLSPTFYDIILHLGYLIPFFENANWISPVYWTLSVEFQYYLILAIAFPLMIHPKLIFRSVFYLFLFITPFIFSNSSFFLYWTSFFGLGILYALYFTKKINLKEFIPVLIILCLSVAINLSYLELLIGIGTLSIIHFFKDFNPRIGEFFGKISYSLYLLHSVFGKPVINFLSHRVSLPYEKFLVVTIGLTISIIAAYALFRLVEKPTHELSKRIKLKT